MVKTDREYQSNNPIEADSEKGANEVYTDFDDPTERDNVSMQVEEATVPIERGSKPNAEVRAITKAQASISDVQAGNVSIQEYKNLEKSMNAEMHVKGIQRTIQNIALLDFLTDPASPIKINLEAGNAAAGSTMSAKAPEMPELYSTDLNKNQMYIAMATQIMGSLAGAIAGDATGGVMAATEAGVAGMNAMVSDIDKRREANVAIKKAYQASVKSYNDNITDMNKTLMKELNANQRKAMEEQVKVLKANQDTMVENQKIALNAYEAKVDSEYKQGLLTKDKAIMEREMINQKRMNLDAMKRVESKNKDRQLKADIENNRVNEALLNMSLKKLKSRKSRINLPDKLNIGVSAAYANKSLSNLADYDDDVFYEAQSFMGQVESQLNSTAGKYSRTEMYNNPEKIREAKQISNNIADLIRLNSTSGKKYQTSAGIKNKGLIINYMAPNALLDMGVNFSVTPGEDPLSEAGAEYKPKMGRNVITGAEGAFGTAEVDLSTPEGNAKLDYNVLMLAKFKNRLDQELSYVTDMTTEKYKKIDQARTQAAKQLAVFEVTQGSSVSEREIEKAQKKIK